MPITLLSAGRYLNVLIALLFAGNAFAETDSSVNHACQEEGIRVQVLGSGGPEVGDQRASSSYLVWRKDNAEVLLDAGSGSSLRFEQANGRLSDIKAILISHFHTDHSSDLVSYIKGAYFSDRVDDLVILGPAGNDQLPATDAYLRRLLSADGLYPYLAGYLQKGREAYVVKPVTITRKKEQHVVANWQFQSLIVPHGPLPALAWRISYGDCSIVYSGDTSDANKQLATFAKAADLLIVHNAISDDAGRIARNLHMTPTQIIDVVRQSAAHKVVLSHFMNRSLPTREQTKTRIEDASSSTVLLAEDLLLINWP
ncbi:MAG: MBL fold metallo-hydrolase [Aestuariibacter sp.]